MGFRIIRRHWAIGLLVLCSGCVGEGTIRMKEVVRQPPAGSADRDRVAIQSLSIYTDEQMSHRYRLPLQYVYFRDSDGTIWEVRASSEDITSWKVYRHDSDGKCVEVPLGYYARAGRVFPASHPLTGEVLATQPRSGVDAK